MPDSARLIGTTAFAALLIATGGLVRQPSAATRAPQVNAVTATYSRGTLHVAIPYDAPRAGAGELTVEVLDPEDRVVGQSKQRVDVPARKAWWHSDLKLVTPLSQDDVVWHRLRYRFSYADGNGAALEGTESISQVLRTPVVHILGQEAYLAGGDAAVRVVVTDSKNEPVDGTASLRIVLGTPKPLVLFSGALNRRGTAQVQFRFPDGVSGRFPLRYVVDTTIGPTEFTHQVRLEDKVAILLTTEKPIYQPGQTIHARALALDRAHHAAAAARALTLEVEDSRGNKVFRKATHTDAFGVASAEFSLAEEVNLGTYHLRALMGEPNAAPTNTAETTLTVERYVLPKFKVALDFDGGAKHGYRPGQRVTGTIHANYFFGKPVDSAEVTVKGSGMDVERFEAGRANGKTDHEGTYRFSFQLPNYFAGRPLSQGASRVLVEAAVKDNAGHIETRGEPIIVSESPLLITVVPEGGTVIPNLKNQVFIVTSYADGTPAPTTLSIRVPGNPDQKAVSDAGGVAVVRMNAGGGGSLPVRVEATDADGHRASVTADVTVRGGAEQVLLRTERAMVTAGERLTLRLYSTRQKGTAFIDVVRQGQTVLTRDVDIRDGRAELVLTSTAEMAGTLDVNAYLFGQDGSPVTDHRLLFVQPADELKIETTTDAPVYKPGDDARVRFRVTNTRGEGVHAALGLQVVDEAVFALAEKRPGFAKVFLYLEEELLKPRYEIHSVGVPELVSSMEKRGAEQRDRAARVLFSAAETVAGNKFETEIGRHVGQGKYPEYWKRYEARFDVQIRELARTLSRTYEHAGRGMDLSGAMAHAVKVCAPATRDSWGSTLRLQRYIDGAGGWYLVKSAGPDKQMRTGDDFTAFLEVRTRRRVGSPKDGPSALDVSIEHDRGPFNGRTEISGTVTDQWGGALEGATIWLRTLSGGQIRSARTDGDGRFARSALAPGDYEIQIVTGSEQISRTISLRARDRAVVSAVIRSEGDVSVVAVDGLRELRVLHAREFDAAAGVVGGVPGGVPGGVIGGVIRVGGDVAMLNAPAAAPAAAMGAEAMAVNTGTFVKTKTAGTEPRARSYFPEALYINPEIITDGNGVATVAIRVADSITTWRMAMLASTVDGALGSGTSTLKVFQDFFVDLDLPVKLTQGDRVSIPVVVYNYSGSSGDVSLELARGDWFALADDVAVKRLAVGAGRVGAAQFTVEATRIGHFKLKVTGRMQGGTQAADIVVRDIEVAPNGREQNVVFNGRLETAAEHQVVFPAAAIPGASKIFVRLYPGPLSQVIEGMDAILRMPFGCFEQTSSATYPNILALDYMKRTKKLTPEVHAKASGFIVNGYQRLLTFEVPGGGFSWFGNAPANKILTAYGLMEFSDMAKVHDVDSRLISRTQEWLAGQQQADGSWKPDSGFINEGATNRYNTDTVRITAYIAWALANTGYRGPAIERARNFVEQRMSSVNMDAYTLAVLANFAGEYGKDREFTRRAMRALLDARTEKGDQAWWTAEETGVFATGASAAVETTGLAAQALLSWGGAPDAVRKALSYIASKKDAAGTWGTTQATIMALRALLTATENGATDVRGNVELSVDGKPVEKLTLTPDNNDLLHQFVFSRSDTGGASTVGIRFAGKGGLAYQVVGRYFVPWDQRPAFEPLSISVGYDRTRLAQDEIATAITTIKNNLPNAAKMVMVDLGIPPGFDLLAEDLQDYQERTAGRSSGRLEKFNLTATQAILYLNALAAGETVTFRFRLRAKYPIRGRTFQSRVYEYYDPEVNSIARPVQLEVRKR